MRIKLQVVIDDEHNGTTVEDIIVLEKPANIDQTIGLSLAELKRLLKQLQVHIVNQPARQYFQSNRCCPHCNRKRRIKDTYTVQHRSLFGIVTLPSKRLYSCQCRPKKAKTFNPLKHWLRDHNSPELLYIEAKWASLMPFGVTANLFKDLLPVSEMTNATTVRNHLYQIARRQEQTLKETPEPVVDCSSDGALLGKPDKPLTVGIDGGYVRDCHNKKTHFEVIVAKSFSKAQSPKRLGFVRRKENDPQHRLMTLLKSQGMQPHQQTTFLSDGADNLRELQYCMYPESEFVLDWFHVSARITVLNQYAKGLIKSDSQIGHTLLDDLESTKHYLWHGNTDKAIDLLEDRHLNCADDDITYKRQQKLLKHLKELSVYIQKNAKLIPNYGEKHRCGETISTAFVESTVNEVISKRMVKKQQMQWSTQGAHHLLQTRTAVLNGELRDQFEQWYPSLKVDDGPSEDEEELSMVA